MPFVRIEGIEGLVWAPDCGEERKKKHPCADCYYCQFCSDDRCSECLAQKAAGKTGGKSCGRTIE